MPFVLDALKLSSEKVFGSIINIIIFRFVYDLITKWVVTGAGAIFLTIYTTNQVRAAMSKMHKSFKRNLCLKQNKPYEEFDSKKLSSEQVKLNQSLKTEYNLDSKCQKDLFSHIFNSGSNSSLLNFITIIAVEYIHNNYGLSIPLSIFYCVSIAFVIIFVSSLRYSSIISKECLSLLETQNDLLDLTEVFYTDSLNNKELVCIWTSLLDPKTNKKKIELKFLSSKYSSNLNDIMEYYATNHMKLKPNEPNQGESEEVEYYSIIIPDYYDIGLIFSNKVKNLGFKQISSWTEYILFPSVNYKLSIYANLSKQEEKMKKKSN